MMSRPFIARTAALLGALASCAGAALLTLPAAAQNNPPDNKKKCNVEAAKTEWTGALPDRLTSLALAISSDRCSSVISVLRQVASGTRTGGRKLEADKPLDVRAAEQELAEARADSFIASEMAAELKGETDPIRQLLLQAAVLHDNGLLKARDLLLSKLRAEAAK